MAVKFTDMDFLRQDPTFQSRVRAGIVQGSIAVGTESDTVPYHRERATYTVQIMNSPDAFVPLFSGACATDSGVINAATANGTVTLTSGNAATQAALVTDAQITTAITNVFNAFFRRPA
jgi:hypothetical protein